MADTIVTPPITISLNGTNTNDSSSTQRSEHDATSARVGTANPTSTSTTNDLANPTAPLTAGAASPGTTSGLAPVVSVPRLDDLALQYLASTYNTYPALDRIPREYLDSIVALLDPNKMDLIMAARFITAEQFWKRLCIERWSINELARHGLSWKRLYMERHLQSAFESYHPSAQQHNYKRLVSEIEAVKPFVHTVRIKQLLSHINLADVLTDFPNLATLELKYGAEKLGMDYDKSLFGMQISDAMGLAHLFARTGTLNRLTLSDNLINDETIQVLLSGITKNNTLTYIDVSHNSIGDLGAQRIAALLSTTGQLTSLNLSDNHIHTTGARALGDALMTNHVLQSLNVSINPLSDQGAADILHGAQNNTSLHTLHMNAVDGAREASKALLTLLLHNHTIRTLHLASNQIAGVSRGPGPGPASASASGSSAGSVSLTSGVGDSLRDALSKNTSITELDIRNNTIQPEIETEIAMIIAKRYASSKRGSRLAYQKGWDQSL